jgi:hypothetical protein
MDDGRKCLKEVIRSIKWVAFMALIRGFVIFSFITVRRYQLIAQHPTLPQKHGGTS